MSRKFSGRPTRTFALEAIDLRRAPRNAIANFTGAGAGNHVLRLRIRHRGGRLILSADNFATKEKPRRVANSFAEMRQEK